MVNLKRPTLRLSPLSSSDDPSGPETLQSRSHHHHGLEFEYDCDAPKCGIYVHVLLPSDHPDAPPASSPFNGLSKLLVFETVVIGGFGNVLKLDDGAMLELGRFESVSSIAKPTHAKANASTTSVSSPPAAEESHATATASRNTRRRFTNFHFRKRSVAGPALAIVDDQPAADGNTGVKKDDADKEGVRVTIRLAALDENGTELASPNEQVTYLHVIRFGAPPVFSSSQVPVNATEGGESSTNNNGESQVEFEDTRPWVVKVVKREATVSHSFSRA